LRKLEKKFWKIKERLHKWKKEKSQKSQKSESQKFKKKFPEKLRSLVDKIQEKKTETPKNPGKKFFLEM